MPPRRRRDGFYTRTQVLPEPIRASATDQDAGERALEAAQDAADDGADAGGRADLAGLTTNTGAFDRLCDRRANRIVAAVDRDLIEAEREHALPFETARPLHRADHA